MDSEERVRFIVRDAVEADVAALTAIKGAGSEAVHRDRIRDAQSTGFRYLVFMIDQQLIGLACLVFRRPAYWSDGKDTQHLPQIVDLEIMETHRGQGYGSAFVRAIERIARESGYPQLYLSVEPQDNPRAHALYHRLGYQQLQAKPYRKTWEFIDSEGKYHHGESKVVDMVKQLGN